MLTSAPSHRTVRSRWLRFVRTYGWRAYALPVLTVITIAATVHDTPGAPHRGPQAARPPASSGTGARANTPRTAPSTSSSGSAGRTVEGLAQNSAHYAAGATPSPVTVNLGTDVTSCANNTYDQLVLVSISRQRLWACDQAKQVLDTPVTTGKVTDGDQTPLGSWRVQDKQRDRYLVGPGYRDYVHYWVPFNGDFGLHDAPWQTMPFGSSDWRTEGSHGCVHVPTTDMAWLYRWASVGNTVVTIES